MKIKSFKSYTYIILFLSLVFSTNLILAQAPLKINCIGLAGDPTHKCSTDKIEYKQLFYFELSDWNPQFDTPANNILYINDIPLPYYVCSGINKNKKRIYFQIGSGKILNNKEKTIIELIRKDFSNYDNNIPLLFGVGNKTGTYAVSSNNNVNFIFFNDIGTIIIGIVAAALFVVLFIFLFKKKTKVLDESGNDPNKSLRKFQLLFWTTLIGLSYFALWLIMLDVPVLPASVLGLLAISFTTFGISSIIPQTKINPPTKGLKGLLVDNNNEFSISRLQYLMFTIIFGVIFLYTTFFELRIYDFSTQQLALMGISASGYVGIKALTANS